MGDSSMTTWAAIAANDADSKAAYAAILTSSYFLDSLDTFSFALRFNRLTLSSIILYILSTSHTLNFSSLDYKWNDDLLY
jgi:hypothetical protein